MDEIEVKSPTRDVIYNNYYYGTEVPKSEPTTSGDLTTLQLVKSPEAVNVIVLDRSLPSISSYFVRSIPFLLCLLFAAFIALLVSLTVAYYYTPDQSNFIWIDKRLKNIELKLNEPVEKPNLTLEIEPE